MNVERSGSAGRAVFLSYASQDAEAARRICEALRAAGVEVWFDQSELRGGDAWDAKIRKQIKECALFVPVISANTQARREGYFRLEWRLAVERMRHMDDDLPFLVPVVIDATKDAEAFVPEKFRDVQWTRLTFDNIRPGAVAVPTLCTQIRALLGNGSGLSTRHSEAIAGGTKGDGPRNLRHRIRPAHVALFGMITLLGVAGAIAWRTHERGAIPATSAVKTEASDLLARAWGQMNSASMARSALILAGEWCQRATTLEPDIADAWAAASQVDTWMVYHNYDPTPARRAQAHDKATRALQIAPRSFEARLAQACYVARATVAPISGPLAAGAERSLRELLAENAEEPRTVFALAILLQRTARYDEAAGLFDRLAQHRDFASVAYNEKGWMFALMPESRCAAALEAAERSIALQPTWANVCLKQSLAQYWLGDLDAAVAALERAPAAAFSEDFMATMAWRLHAWRRDPAAMLRAVAALPGDWVRASPYEGPKALLTGVAHAMAGNGVAAEAAWRSGLKLVEDRLAGQPDRTALLLVKGELLARLGDPAEAAKAFELARQITSNPLRVERYATVHGRDAQKALAHLERGMASGGFEYTAASLRLNPELDWLRRDPGFAALQAKADADPRLSPKAGKSESATPITDLKSVAVLAFENLSDDKANEYFSDGISEELLNVLGKLPGLRVAARTSAFSFKGSKTLTREIGRQLGVAHLVEGSVRRAGGRARVMVRLIQADTGAPLWGETYDKELTDVFALQEEIARDIAQKLQIELRLFPGIVRQVNAEAHRQVLEGRHFLIARTEEAFARAETAFTAALRLDPDFAAAHAGLGDVCVVRAVFRMVDGLTDFDQDLRRAKESAERAVALDPTIVEAHAVLGYQAVLVGRLDDAEQHFQRGLALNPNDAFIHHWHAHLLTRRGRLDLALEENRRAIELDPLHWAILYTYAYQLVYAQRLAEASELIRRAMALRPDFVPLRGVEAAILFGLGRRDEAVRIALAVRNDPNPLQRSRADINALMVLRKAGRNEEASAYASELTATWPRFGSKHQDLCAALERFDEVFAEMEVKPCSLFRVQQYFWSDVWDPVRNDRRFIARITELGLLKEYEVARATRAQMMAENRTTETSLPGQSSAGARAAGQKSEVGKVAPK